MKLKPSIRTPLSLILVALATAACDSSDPEPPPPPPEPENIRFVDGVNGNDQAGENDCADSDMPCQTISHAIDVSIGGDVIQIANAEYTEMLDIPRSLTLQGQSEEGTIIQAHAQPGQADGRVITIDGDFEVDIANLTIRRGHATSGFPDNRGGGILNDGATVNLTNITFSNNEATHGGGMFNVGGTSMLTNVTFRENIAETSGGGMRTLSSSPTLTGVLFDSNEAGESGGGMANNNSAPMLRNVTFDENEASGSGGGMRNNEGSSPTLTNVIFRNNSSDGNGGGMSNFNSSSPTLSNVIFAGNQSSNQGGGMANGGSDGVSSPALTNVVFLGNRACCGGGMRNDSGASPTLTNVSFSGNVATSNAGGALNNVNASPTLTNVVMWNNQAAGSTSSTSASIGNSVGYSNTDSRPHISYSLIANSGGSDNWNNEIGVDGGDNLDVDPQFLDTPNPDNAPTTNGNLRHSEGSPPMNAGDPQTNPLLFPTDENDNPVDLDGNPRFFGDGDIVDIGAYEFNPNAAAGGGFAETRRGSVLRESQGTNH